MCGLHVVADFSLKTIRITKRLRLKDLYQRNESNDTFSFNLSYVLRELYQKMLFVLKTLNLSKLLVSLD